MKIHNKWWAIAFVFVVATCLIFAWSTIEKSENIPFYKLPQQVKSVRLSQHYSFAGEEMPVNDDTRERMDRELLVNAYWQSSTVLHIKLAQKYFPEILPILKEQNIPEDFLYLAVAESSLRNATSSSNAKGFWQFMKPTALELGLVINDEIDERNNIKKSTLAACRYFHQLKTRFSTWSNVAAAYNMGPTAFSNARTKQKEASFYDMSLSEETMRYIFRIMAIKEILRHPEDFGYFIEDEHSYNPLPAFTYHPITETIPSLADFAHEKGVSYRLLKYYNPWLIAEKVSPVPGKELTIRIPREG